jgi:hypothetical protein
MCCEDVLELSLVSSFFPGTILIGSESSHASLLFANAVDTTTNNNNQTHKIYTNQQAE